jgi:Lysine methyltransferase
MMAMCEGTVRRSVSTAACASTAATTTRTAPLLLLECGDFFVSEDGISRTLYFHNGRKRASPVVEEIYDMKAASKTYLVRNQKQTATKVHPGDADNHISLLRAADPHCSFRSYVLQAKIDIHEMKDIVHIGTGATTWEASIVASIFFSEHPHLLQGDLIEIGCGLGLSGILIALAPSFSGQSTNLHSITLTDYCRDVLKQCESNVQGASAAFSADHSGMFPSFFVSKLDWNSFIKHPNGKYGSYDTILACDVAYHYEDVEAIGIAVQGLLKRSTTAKAHLFGPCNRSVLLEVVRYMKVNLNMAVEVETIDMSRMRLKPRTNSVAWKNVNLDECRVASSETPKYLHVTVAHRLDGSERTAPRQDACVFDID